MPIQGWTQIVTTYLELFRNPSAELQPLDSLFHHSALSVLCFIPGRPSAKDILRYGNKSKQSQRKSGILGSIGARHCGSILGCRVVQDFDVCKLEDL